jgi:hypothetical protein
MVSIVIPYFHAAGCANKLITPSKSSEFRQAVQYKLR